MVKFGTQKARLKKKRKQRVAGRRPKVRSKWKREMLAKDDRKQMVLEPEYTTGCRERPKYYTIEGVDMSQIVSCPFCLHMGKLQEFLVSTAKGISKHRMECPECKNGMAPKSLMAEWTPEEYAEWVYNYGHYGFWKKIPFDLWKKRLAQIGWAPRFWSRYKALKGEETEESYDEYAKRTQEEIMREESTSSERG